MERVALQNLIDWNNNPRRKPLIVWGARQVGKTYLVQELFAEQVYKNKYLYIDFKKEDEIRSFCHETANAEKIIEYISLRKGKIIDENAKYGNSFINNLSVELKINFPNMKGFSERNLKYMRKFVDEYQDEKFLQEVLAKITWYHNVILMEQENLITTSCKTIKINKSSVQNTEL